MLAILAFENEQCRKIPHFVADFIMPRSSRPPEQSSIMHRFNLTFSAQNISYAAKEDGNHPTDPGLHYAPSTVLVRARAQHRAGVCARVRASSPTERRYQKLLLLLLLLLLLQLVESFPPIKTCLSCAPFFHLFFFRIFFSSKV